MTNEQKNERLKDRRAYRSTLIHKRNELDVKLSEVETQIAALKDDTPDAS